MIKAQLSKFIIIGLLSTLLNYSIFYVLYILTPLNYLLASCLGFISGVLFGYSLNKDWTFSVEDNRSDYFFKYLGIYLFSLITGISLLNFTVEIAKIKPEIANAIIIIYTSCVNFIGSKFWVFKK